MIISSRSNPMIKEIRSLRERKQRERSGLFFVEGIRIVAEAAQVGAAIERLIVAPTLLTSRFAQEIVAAQREAGVPCLEVTAEVFASLSVKDSPQGLGAVVQERWTRLDEAAPWWIALSGVQDPGNLGTILRTGDAVGTAGVLLIGQTADPFDPEAVRASMGAIFSQRVVRTTLQELAAWKAAHQFTLVGTSDAAATDYQGVTYPARLILFMGSEQHGLSAEEQALCDVMVRIPMVGRSDSLNLAVATGITLYEIFNQHRMA
jgi:TrmH family RNA methyltransferase